MYSLRLDSGSSLVITAGSNTVEFVTFGCHLSHLILSYMYTDVASQDHTIIVNHYKICAITFNPDPSSFKFNYSQVQYTNMKLLGHTSDRMLKARGLDFEAGRSFFSSNLPILRIYRLGRYVYNSESLIWIKLLANVPSY